MPGPHDATFPKSVPPIDDDVNRVALPFHKGSYATTEQANLIDPVVKGMGHPAEIFAGINRVEVESNPYSEQAEEPENEEEASYEELPSKVDEALGNERDDEDKSGDQSQGSSVDYYPEAAKEGARDSTVESSGKSGVSNLDDHTEKSEDKDSPEESADDFETKVDKLKVSQLDEVESKHDDLDGEGNRDERRDALKNLYKNSKKDAKNKLAKDVNDISGE